MAEVLGRVTTRSQETPRGPDVTHRIRVRSEWLENGDVVEFEVPRNLTCAACEGGGCDACERAGAITLRGRQEPPEIIQVTLPKRAPEESTDGRGVIIRLPEQGGLPREGSNLPRGLLMLRVVGATQADPEVRLVARSLLPAPTTAMEKIASIVPPRSRVMLLVAAMVIVCALAALYWFVER